MMTVPGVICHTEDVPRRCVVPLEKLSTLLACKISIAVLMHVIQLRGEIMGDQ